MPISRRRIPRRLEQTAAVGAIVLVLALAFTPSVAASDHECGVIWPDGGPDALCKYPSGEHAGTRCEVWISQHTPFPPCLNPIPGFR